MKTDLGVLSITSLYLIYEPGQLFLCLPHLPRIVHTQIVSGPKIRYSNRNVKKTIYIAVCTAVCYLHPSSKIIDIFIRENGRKLDEKYFFDFLQ